MASSGRWRGRSDVIREPLLRGWALCSSPPHAVSDPSRLDESLEWLTVDMLGPVGEVLRQRHGDWSVSTEPRRLDAEDWWYRLRFDAPEHQAGDLAMLGFDGLATVAQVWLNGELLLSCGNMFLAWQCDASDRLKPEGNELVLVFRALDQVLTQRRPRPRWRAPMVEHQQLRWIRTTLLGRTPSWTPPVAAVGPWRGIWLERGRALELGDVKLIPRVVHRQGVLDISCDVGTLDASASVDRLVLRLSRGDLVHETRLAPHQDGQTFTGTLSIDEVDLWWPHTHGEPALYQAHLQAHLAGRQEPIALDLGSVGFRSVKVRKIGGDFSIEVNEVPVFCRGASWMPLDPITLRSPVDACVAALDQVRHAGMNMLRLAGSMVYEADAFYDACDQMGIMVWQDFMFSNMDYPGEDAEFCEQVVTEARQQLGRLQGRPCLTVLCGNSEIEQQAAMWAAPRERWQPALFHQVLADVAAQWCPDLPYWPSSAHGGSFPHKGDEGTTSYYGVGVYLRPLEDARRSNLRFATECLGLANEPEQPTVRRIPDDSAIGGNFEVVRDHYLALLFKLDPAQLREADHERYLTLSRVTSGEVMAATFNEWRRTDSTCRGALVWFLRDVWPGAGFGLIDSDGTPKSCYHYLKRVLQPLSVSISDEGCNGLYAHVVNERPQALKASLDITAYRSDGMPVGQGVKDVVLPPRGACTLPLMDWFEWFIDLSYAYRFGPPSAHVVAATLLADDGAMLAQAFAFPAGMNLPTDPDLCLQATASLLSPGLVQVTVSTNRFAQAVHVKLGGHVADDAYFHLPPGASKTVLLRSAGKPFGDLTAEVVAINAAAAVPIQWKV